VTDELNQRHAAFWAGEDVGRPLLEGRAPSYWASVAAMYADRDGVEIGPDEADAERYISALHWPRAREAAEQDLFPVLPPNPRMPWLEAIAGARVIPHLGSDSIWSERPARSLVGRREVEVDEAWLDALLDQLERLPSMTLRDVPVTQTLMRGPGDVLEALLGAEELLLAMKDEADWLGPLIGSVTELFIEVARLQWERVRPWRGGYVNFYGFWSPAPCVRVQEDVQRTMGPELFRRWLRPALCDIVAAFPYSMFHMHSGSLHLLDEVVGVPGLGGLQVSVDEPPYAAPIGECVEPLQRAQERVALFVQGPMSDADYAALLEGLSPAGLAIHREPGA
jgi:hypothetical protein